MGAGELLSHYHMGQCHSNKLNQEDYLAKYSTEDRDAVEESRNDKPEDPMQGLEGLDVAGPKPE
jgi:hypothetical protein